MKINKVTLKSSLYPPFLRDIHAPPKVLYTQGALEELLHQPKIAIVGSRKVTAYGKTVTRQLAEGCSRAGIVIVSGLALGVDAIGHQAALDTGGKTIAVLPSSIEQIYPATHRQLASNILKQGGALISEYPEGTEPFRTNFIARNRIVSGLSDAVLITEAAERSGTLHTANFALEQGKTVMAVPGNITSPYSTGTNNLIKAGALPITSIEDILNALNITKKPVSNREIIGATPEEAQLLQLLTSGISDAAILLAESGLEAPIFNQTLTMLEINGHIRPLGAGHWTIL